MGRPTRRWLLRQAGRWCAGSALARSAFSGPFARAADTAATLPALHTRPSTGPIPDAAKSLVARVRWPEVVDRDDIHEILLREMIEDAVRTVAGESTAGEAWNRLFAPDDIIGVKFNQVGFEALGTGDAFARQLVGSLGDAGFAPERIVLIEAPLNLVRKLKTRPRVYGWSDAEASFPSGSERLASVLDDVSALINVPFYKTHNIAIMTGCLKNLSHALIRRPARYHANACTPYAGEIVALPGIRSKLRINVVNALRALCDGGPHLHPSSPGLFNYAGILASTDPVAADAVGINIINDQRAKAKLAPIGDAQGHIPHVHHAATIGLGTDDQDYINLVDVTTA